MGKTPMALKRVNVFTVSPGGIVPNPGPDAANLQYDFETNQIFAVTRTTIKPVTQPQSLASAAFESMAGSSTIAIGSSTSAIVNKSISASSTSVTFDFSELQNGSQVNIEYFKTTASSCTLTFPTGALIRNQDGQEEAGVTTTITGTAESVFLISVIKTATKYLVAVSRFKL